MEKSYTFPQVIENMEFGEVAVKVSGFKGIRFISEGMYIYFDENDNGALKSNEGHRVTPSKGTGNEPRDMFVIMSKEAYLKMKNL